MAVPSRSRRMLFGILMALLAYTAGAAGPNPGTLYRRHIAPQALAAVDPYMAFHADYRLQLYKSLPPAPAGGTLFLGDSLIMCGSWHERWPGGATERGVPGARVSDFLRFVPEVARHKPSVIVVLCGINDLRLQQGDPQTVFAEYSELVRGLLANTNAKLRLCSVLPVADSWPDSPALLNPRVVEFNRLMAGSTDDDRVEFVDIRPAVCDNSGKLRSEMTIDGVHLTPAGYAVWLELLRYPDKP